MMWIIIVVMRKNIDSPLVHCLCGVCTFSPRLCGFSLGTLVFSHIPKLGM